MSCCQRSWSGSYRAACARGFEEGIGIRSRPRGKEPGRSLAMDHVGSNGNQFSFAWDGGEENAPRQPYVSLAGKGISAEIKKMPESSAGYPAWLPQTTAHTLSFVSRDTFVVDLRNGNKSGSEFPPFFGFRR